MAEQTQSCRAQLEFPSQKSIAEQPWSQEAKGIFNGRVQRGEDSPPQALQHPGASPFPDTKVSPWCHWGGQPGFVTTASPSTAPLPARGTKPQQDSAQVGLEMGTPEPPSQLGHPQLTSVPFVHLDKVASNFKAASVLHSTALQFCIPGFMKQGQRQMSWQAAGICRHTRDLL